jgi:hypothetical protein
MDLAQAQRVIESLRKGIPPDGFVRHFTVGRAWEIAQLINTLDRAEPGALLLKANYGSGKTHLLHFTRECALERGFAVSAVTLDARGAVRFNRMDQVFGAVCRNIEVPGVPGQKGIRPLLDFVVDRMERAKVGRSESFWHELTNNWKWDFSEVLDSPAMFVAVRAWATGNSAIHDRVEAWFLQPSDYRSLRKVLYSDLVGSLRRYFHDPRPEWQFYKDGVFDFQTQGYAQSWSALRDIQRLLCESGLKGLVLLFDEFEDVITNLRNVAHQEAAFWNLFQFYAGKRFPGLSFFAVTPEFVEKCEKLLMDKGRWDYDYARFEAIPTFQMTPLDVEELEELAMRILETHGIAYEWEPDLVMRSTELDKIVRKATSLQIQDRARHTIITVVKALDRLLEENE